MDRKTRTRVTDEQHQQDGGEPPKRKRGRPRDPGANRRILDAARAVAGELGVHGASMSAIADRSGVGKPTIYLRWANRREVIVAAIADLRADVPQVEGRDVRDELNQALKDDRTLLVSGPESRFLRSALFESAEDVEIARELSDSILGPRRQRIVEILERGMGDGELRSDIDPGAVADLLIAPLVRGMVLGGEGASAEDVEQHTALVAGGIAAYAETSEAG
jgi:AcrR family transcriptional regulator